MPKTESTPRVAPQFAVLRAAIIHILAKSKMSTHDIAAKLDVNRSYVIRLQGLAMKPRTAAEKRIVKLAAENEGALQRLGFGYAFKGDIETTLAGGDRMGLPPERRGGRPRKDAPKEAPAPKAAKPKAEKAPAKAAPKVAKPKVAKPKAAPVEATKPKGPPAAKPKATPAKATKPKAKVSRGPPVAKPKGDEPEVAVKAAKPKATPAKTPKAPAKVKAPKQTTLALESASAITPPPLPDVPALVDDLLATKESA